ncbi:MAG: heterocyst frequency control protein PatD [Cyanobacteria bacterium P01_D01_bin.156]
MGLQGSAEAIETYKNRLEKIQAGIGEDGLVQHAQALQQFFSHTLWEQLTQAELSQQAQWDAVLTELHRDMRLFLLDVNFVQAASQGQSRQLRLEKLSSRIGRLQEFATVLGSLLADEDTT